MLTPTVCGELPTGTRFDPATGRISGRPTTVVLRPTPLRVAETSPSGRSAASFIYVVNRSGVSSFNYPAHPYVRVGKRVLIRPTITGMVTRTSPPHTITIVAVTKSGALVVAAPAKITFSGKPRSSS